MTYQPPPPPPNDPAGSQQPTGPGEQWQPPAPPPPQGGQYQQPQGQPQQWGPPPTPPAQSQWGGPARPGGQFDPKTVNQLDWGILGAGVLAFIFSLFSYYSISYGPYSATYSAWHGFFGWFAALLAIVGSAVVAVELFSPQTKLPAPARLVGLGCYAVATLCVILAIFVIPDGGAGDISGVDSGHGFAFWISLIVIIAGLGLSYLRFTQTGGQLPVGNRGSSTPPPPPGY